MTATTIRTKSRKTAPTTAVVFWDGNTRLTKAQAKARELRVALAKAEAEQEAAERAQWEIIQRLAALPVDCEARQTARSSYPWWFLNGPDCETRRPYPTEFTWPD